MPERRGVVFVETTDGARVQVVRVMATPAELRALAAQIERDWTESVWLEGAERRGVPVRRWHITPGFRVDFCPDPARMPPREEAG